MKEPAEDFDTHVRETNFSLGYMGLSKKIAGQCLSIYREILT